MRARFDGSLVVTFFSATRTRNYPVRLSTMAKPASSDPTTGSPTASVIKAYSLPLVLFVAAMFFQLFVVPKSFPPSHYDILGIRSYTSIEEVKEAYDNISSVWSSDGQALDTSNFIQIEYAYELLTNPVWKRMTYLASMIK